MGDPFDDLLRARVSGSSNNSSGASLGGRAIHLAGGTSTAAAGSGDGSNYLQPRPVHQPVRSLDSLVSMHGASS